MKNIVLEINRNEAVILSDDGTVSKIKNKGYSIGQMISMKNTKKPKSKIYTFASGFVAAMIILTVGAFAYFTPVSYVSLDVNPSIEYSINLFDRVLSIKSVNEDGEKIIQNLNLKNKKIAVALEETLDKIVAEGYITKGENAGVVISVSDSAKAEVLINEIFEKTEKYLEENNETAEIDVDVEVEAVGRERVAEARKLGITPGKLNLIEKLRDSTDDPDDFVIEDWMDKSVKEINKAVNENRKNKKADDKFDVEDDDDDDDKYIKERNQEKNQEKNTEQNKEKNINGKNLGSNADDDDDDDDNSEKEKNKEKNTENNKVKNNNGKFLSNNNDDDNDDDDNYDDDDDDNNDNDNDGNDADDDDNGNDAAAADDDDDDDDDNDNDIGNDNRNNNKNNNKDKSNNGKSKK
ncbi:MAG: anti-sigma-I factor RsgI family protein [Acetivibrionales bacterium]|jgi:ribosomal protein S9